MATSENELILIAIVPEALKDNVVDSLMTGELLSGFSLSKIQGFSKAHSHYSVSEQVEGYRYFYRFELAHNSKQTDLLVELLGSVSANKSIRYWLVPLLDEGLI